jgi:uncharacterized protein (TIGR03086 family)
MTVESLEHAFATTRAILANVTPDDYERSTPCASWNVRSLVNHMVEGANWFALCVDGGAAPDPDPTHGVDYAAGDLLDAYDRGVKATIAAFGAPGALERVLALPFGEMPAAAFLTIATNDVVTHGWDLARATGQPSDIEPQLAAELLTQLQAFLPDAMRGPDGEAPFGPAVEAAGDAPAADRLAAFLGRPS